MSVLCLETLPFPNSVPSFPPCPWGSLFEAISSGKHPPTPKSQQGLPVIFSHDTLPFAFGTAAVCYLCISLGVRVLVSGLARPLGGKLPCSWVEMGIGAPPSPISTPDFSVLTGPQRVLLSTPDGTDAPINKWSSWVAQMVKNLPATWETWVRSLSWEDPLEKNMATHSSILAWRISWTEEPGGLRPMGLQRVGHDLATNTSLSAETAPPPGSPP